MIWPSRPALHTARDVDAWIAAEWELEELFTPLAATRPAPAAAPSADEQDALLEAIAAANQARERELAQERERAVAEAFARGFEAGRREGEEQESARLRHAHQALQAALNEVDQSAERWTGAGEENLCALAVGIARHLLGRELEGDADGIADLVRRALTEFPLDQPVRIRLHPTDLAALATIGGAGQPIPVASGREARWLADPGIEPGGCVVEGRERIVDGRVDLALERVYRRLSHHHA